MVNDAKVDDHHAIIPTASSTTCRIRDDERRIYDLVARPVPRRLPPGPVYERTRIETTRRGGHVRRAARCCRAWAKAVYGDEARDKRAEDDDPGGDQELPKLEQGEEVETRESESPQGDAAAARGSPRRRSCSAMETAGKDIDDAELREAMKDRGSGRRRRAPTPSSR